MKVRLRDKYQANGQPTATSTTESRGPQVLLAVVFIFLCGALGWMYWKSRSLAVETDSTTLCPTRQAPPALVAILLDVSDQLSEPQLIKIENEIDRLRDGLPRWGRVEVYVVARHGERLTEPVIQVCNPGTGADMNALYQNPDLAKKKWNAFAQSFRDQVTALIGMPDTATSLIFESIQSIALRTFDRSELDGVAKRLVVISDLLQNNPSVMSHYRGVPDFVRFAESPYFSRVRADLDNVSVTVLYLQRSDVAVQGSAHIEFWEKYFAAQGATVQEVKKVFGDQ